MKIKCEYSDKGIEVGKVKPCPFCGEVEHIKVTNPETFGELVEEHGHSMITVECKNCDLTLALYDVPDNNYMLGMGRLIERWNHRA